MIQLTAELLFTSKTIGLPTKAQMNELLAVHGLGTLLSFNETKEGAMKQTLSIVSTKGEWIVKGNPIYEGQLEEEKYVIDCLAGKTSLQVPTPYIVHHDPAILGFAYSIMPKMKGKHLHDVAEKLIVADHSAIARSLAGVLKEMHEWKSLSYGQLHPLNHTIEPFHSSYKDWLFNRIVHWFHDAKKYSTLTEGDERWLYGELRRANDVFSKMNDPCFIMGDVKPGNFLIDQLEGQWAISGLFDFTNSYFADPLVDLTKMTLFYQRQDLVDNANQFIAEYTTGQPVIEVQLRLRIHLLHQLVLDWGYFHAMGQPIHTSFEKWVRTIFIHLQLE